ncbi:hypothetical protein SAMN05216499_14510 [Actinacidiphila paucisporea]|uniref:Transposase n=1 Tax=Actinacidiphila paucisporea TaxID=310782 RepID=A0A1M7QW16_9ACTN|nr:hypothetical protein SAMN05216499_14510 [Actinacidiphila paucisporea]
MPIYDALVEELDDVPAEVRLTAERTVQKNAETATALRISVRFGRAGRRAWRECGEAGVLSKGSPGRSRLSEDQIAGLERELERGPLAHGWADQRWTLARIKTLIGRLFPCLVHGRGHLAAVEADPGRVETSRPDLLRWLAEYGLQPATPQQYFARWRKNGTDKQIHDRLRMQVREHAGRPEDPSAVVLDSQSVRAAAGVPKATTGLDAGKKALRT